MKTITTKNMTIIDAQNNLRDWLNCEALGIKGNYFALCRRAYDLLGYDEYDRIYKQTVYDYTGTRLK